MNYNLLMSLKQEEARMKRKRKWWLFVVVPLLAVILFAVGALVRLSIRTKMIRTDYSSVFTDDKYKTPVYVDGVKVITQDVSCGYACIEMFSAWNGGSVTEKSLYDTYGKVITSTGKKFCSEMNKQFPEYKTTMHKYVRSAELIDLMYDNLAAGIPTPFEWAAKYGDDWTLHYSLLVGMDIPNNKITIANPYGYIEEITVDELLTRTSFEAYENMPLFFKMAFAIGIFEKNTVFTVSR